MVHVLLFQAHFKETADPQMPWQDAVSFARPLDQHAPLCAHTVPLLTVAAEYDDANLLSQSYELAHLANAVKQLTQSYELANLADAVDDQLTQSNELAHLANAVAQTHLQQIWRNCILLQPTALYCSQLQWQIATGMFPLSCGLPLSSFGSLMTVAQVVVGCL